MNVKTTGTFFTPSFFLLLVTGVFVAVDGALINDVLPSCTEFAKDLGVYNIAVSLPFILSMCTGTGKGS